jgi:hypothetical protein
MPTCPVCNDNVTPRDNPVPGATASRDEAGSPVPKTIRYLGAFHPDCWEAFQQRHPDGIEVATCPDCEGLGTVVVPAKGDATDEMVSCDPCSGTGWVEVAA